MRVKTFAAYYDHDVRYASSSGGVFSLLAQQFDVVYGVAMTDDCYGAEFIRAEQDISLLRGSKYLQAHVGETYKNVEKDLKLGKQVLFSGTGCQVNGLKYFLGKEYENLFCLDVICHGVPSPFLWEMYIKHHEQKRGKKVSSVNFRCKEVSWRNFGMKKDATFASKEHDPYMQMFLRNYCLRPSCYQCKVKTNKLSDMTIGDFWGIESVAPEMDDDHGVSIIIVRSEKADALLKKVEQDLRCKEVSYEEGVKCNPSEHSSVEMPQSRDAFFDDMHSMTFQKLTQKYVRSSSRWRTVIGRCKRKLKSILTAKPMNCRGGYGILLVFLSDSSEGR